MLPIDRAEIHYPDGSVYHIPEDGTWAEAPPFGVQAVVYYHVPDFDGVLQRITKDGGRGDGDVYVWRGEKSGPDYRGMKMGLWMDPEGFYRIQRFVTGRTEPEV